jgi:PPK2 family polyphosphate:nucleotide phosphotransferase
MGKKSKTADRASGVHKLDHRPFLVTPGSKHRLSDFDPAYTAGFRSKKKGRAALLEDISALASAQALLWANAQRSVLIILQAMDAAGKDGAIKHVMSGVNPQGVDVHSFKAPNDEDLLHHFLWRPMRKIPARGRIAVFNRSYYEEVLVVRIHPKFLDRQFLPARNSGRPLTDLWQTRFDDINRFEQLVTGDDVTIIKFFLNVSKDEQRQRFLDRLNDPAKHWKFSAADLRERKYWDDYQQAYEEMLNATSTERAPWYVIPADHKWFARAAIADIITSRIEAMALEPPQATKKQKSQLEACRLELLDE